MAHDIKKRSASHIYFGVHSKSGEIMHISKVPSGQKCNCVCAACGQLLFLCQREGLRIGSCLERDGSGTRGG